MSNTTARDPWICNHQHVCDMHARSLAGRDKLALAAWIRKVTNGMVDLAAAILDQVGGCGLACVVLRRVSPDERHAANDGHARKGRNAYGG